MLVDGELAHAAAGEAFDNVSPATGLVLGQTAAAGVPDMDRAIAAAGNPLVLKPDPNTPWNAPRLGRLIAEHTDIPAGVVNVVPTSSNDVAGLLGTDPRVDMISFTGSTSVGKLLMRQGADTMKRMF